MTLVIVEEETHKKLWHYKVEHNFRTHDQAIADLLERVQNEPSKAKSKV